jgi:hypothetical protein
VRTLPNPTDPTLLTVTIRCPFCGDNHEHRAKRDAETEYRVPRCTDVALQKRGLTRDILTQGYEFAVN